MLLLVLLTDCLTLSLLDLDYIMMNSSSKMLDGEKGDMTQQSVLNAFDFSAIEEMDPSLGK